MSGKDKDDNQEKSHTNPFPPNDRRENQETAILYRVDERTLQIMHRLERLQEWSENQDSRLAEIENQVTFHQTVIKGILFVLAALVTSFIGNIMGLISF